MTSPKRGYLLGLGSNIDPFQHTADMITALLALSPQLHLSRIVHIPPVGMNTHHYFLNAVVFIETDWDAATLKTQCNQIEIRLGRDREDPNSKFKDRPADIDILAPLTFPDDQSQSARSLTDEYFLYPLIDELFAYLSNKPTPETIQTGVRIETQGLTFGETATTIYRDGHTS